MKAILYAVIVASVSFCAFGEDGSGKAEPIRLVVNYIHLQSQDLMKMVDGLKGAVFKDAEEKLGSATKASKTEAGLLSEYALISSQLKGFGAKVLSDADGKVVNVFGFQDGLLDGQVSSDVNVVKHWIASGYSFNNPVEVAAHFYKRNIINSYMTLQHTLASVEFNDETRPFFAKLFMLEMLSTLRSQAAFSSACEMNAPEKGDNTPAHIGNCYSQYIDIISDLQAKASPAGKYDGKAFNAKVLKLFTNIDSDIKK